MLKSILPHLKFRAPKPPPHPCPPFLKPRQQVPGLPDPIPFWDEDPGIQPLMREVGERTLLTRVGCYMLLQYARLSASLQGEAAEVGVYKGGSALILCRAFEGAGKTVHLFDTFTGHPEPDPRYDWHREGQFGDLLLEDVRAFLSRCPNARIHPGLFPVTAVNLNETTFCFVHIDVDIYPSARDCCNFFYGRMAAGGIMFFDDYGLRTCPGVKRAVDEFFSDKPEQIMYLPTGQAYITRRG